MLQEHQPSADVSMDPVPEGTSPVCFQVLASSFSSFIEPHVLFEAHLQQKKVEFRRPGRLSGREGLTRPGCVAHARD